MAVRDRRGNLRGRAGDKINRVLGGKNIVQAVPDGVNQTEATKRCSGEWGLVSISAITIPFRGRGVRRERYTVSFKADDKC